MNAASNDLLFVFDRPLYDSQANRELLDMAMAAAAFDRPVALLFRGPAVLWIAASDTSTEAIEQKNLVRQLGALPVYGIDRLYAEQSALESFGIDNLAQPGIKPLNGEQVADLYQSFNRIIQW